MKSDMKKRTYESPKCKVIQMELSSIMAASGSDTPAPCSIVDEENSEFG